MIKITNKGIPFKFTYEHEKLNDSNFTTIRLHQKNRKVNDECHAYSPTKKFNVIITKIKSTSLGKIPLEVLQKDIAPIKIESCQDFIKGLQPFYPKTIIDVDTIGYIFYLRKL